MLLDWEYAHVSDALWDLAGWSCNNDLEPRTRSLTAARAISADRPRRRGGRASSISRWLYDYVCLLWSELYCRTWAAAEARAASARARFPAERLCARAGLPAPRRAAAGTASSVVVDPASSGTLASLTANGEH